MQKFTDRALSILLALLGLFWLVTVIAIVGRMDNTPIALLLLVVNSSVSMLIGIMIPFVFRANRGDN